jgi:Chloroplast envelope transporter
VNPSPFSRREPVRPTLVQRLLRRKPAGNALVDVLRSFEQADSPRDVRPVHLERIAAEYGVDPRTAFRADLERMYREYLVHCLVDRRLSEDEISSLDHLRSLFGLDATTCEAIHRNVARQIYLKSVAEVLADGAIDEDEREFLARVRDQLAIPEAVAENIVEMKRRQYESRNRPAD